MENLGEELILATTEKLLIDQQEFGKKVEELKDVNCDHGKP